MLTYKYLKMLDFATTKQSSDEPKVLSMKRDTDVSDKVGFCSIKDRSEL